MVTVMSRFRVRNGLEAEVRNAFLNRPRLVEKVPGFCGIDVMTDAADPSVFLLLTRWTDEETFRAWHKSDGHHHSHEMMPRGLKLDASFTSLTVGISVEDPAGIRNLSDSLEGQTVALSRWLMESDSVFALLLAPDGVIRERSQAAWRLFPPDPAKNFGLTVWDYLKCSDVSHLRELLLGTESPYAGRLLLNLADTEQNPVTFEISLVRHGHSVLMLGTQERRHESHFQNEILKLNNDLSLMMRDAAQANRDLKEANKTIERLARTDGLTGLANRRSLDEAFVREIARAERSGQPLSMILADLDHFKSINDRYGHTAGDQVLICAAKVFGGRLRRYDLAARYGGEELVLLLPGTSADIAISIAERIRREVAAINVPGLDVRFTLSLGVAAWKSGEKPGPFLARADAALYQAKNAGRNRVEAGQSFDASWQPAMAGER